MHGTTQNTQALRTGPSSLNATGHVINDHMLDSEDDWFKQGVREAVYCKTEQLLLSRGDGNGKVTHVQCSASITSQAFIQASTVTRMKAGWNNNPQVTIKC